MFLMQNFDLKIEERNMEAFENLSLADISLLCRLDSHVLNANVWFKKRRKAFESFSLADISPCVTTPCVAFILLTCWHAMLLNLTLNTIFWREFKCSTIVQLLYNSGLFMCLPSYHTHQHWTQKQREMCCFHDHIMSQFSTTDPVITVQHIGKCNSVTSSEREVRWSFPGLFGRWWKENTRYF